MLQRRRRTPRPIAIVDLARELLELGEPSRYSWEIFNQNRMRLTELTDYAESIGYWQASTYFQALLSRHSWLRMARERQPGPARDQALDKARRFLSVVEAVAQTLHLDAGADDE